MTDHDANAVRILLVDDDEDDYVVTRELLADSRRTPFALEWIANFDDAIDAIVRDEHDLYLIDYRLGEHDGLELLAHAAASGCTKPLILLTGLADGDVDLAAMRAGAADYLVKGQIDSDLLERAIRYALEQNRTLHALRESEERYALSARGANDGLWVWDIRTNEVYYSPRWKSMLGYGEDEIGESPDEWFSRVHEDDIDILRRALDHHLLGHTPHFENEHRMRTKSGEVRWMLSRGLAVRDASGYAMRIAGSQTDITERKRAEERLTFDAFHDALTQLPNRALFMDRLQRAIDAQRRHPGSMYAVLFLDLDRFKVVNDSLGHMIGDELLVAVAERLRATVRASDTVARLGGDEFAVLVEDINDVGGAVRMARRIHDDLTVPFTIASHEIFTTVSTGIAVSTTGYERPEDVLRDADIAMYRAKAQGKARHEVFDAAMHARAVELLQFETDLRRAIDRGELRLLYQPIVALDSGEVCGVEALVRWQRGAELVGADAIIPVAEENGLILPIGDWVLRESLRQLSEWDEAGFGSGQLEMHVNLSARQLLQPDVVERVRAALEESGIAARRLHLEVTESVLIESADAAAQLLRDLRAIEVRLSLDDFGTGYSSLSSLRQFPFDMLKIDRSFLHDADARRGDDIVRTIASLARLLGMQVTVEGLETSDQTARMRELHVDFAQGFYFARPLAPQALTELRAMR
ncbi:MAG TPA: EAL domain-containing protein [Thermoanaerobaculia bacterium]|nr:EAL domain-containing protein [Thermoanaerobaculia bacterium]